MKSMRNRTALVAVILLGATHSAVSAPPAPPPSIWAAEPSPEQRRQAKVGAPGRAVLRCHVDDAGALSACRTISEAPAGQGLGEAALSLMSRYRMKPELVKSEAPGGERMMVESWDRFDTPPDWVRKPTQADLLVVWPKEAWRRGLGGRAVISCLVSLQGALFDCLVESESPSGQNFGAAAIALTPQFLMKPGRVNGQAVVSAVNIPINFHSFGGGGGDMGRKMVAATMAWPEAPTYADVAAAYPKKAREAHLAGRATLDCEFQASGRLHNCHAVAEEPKGKGFGDAAETLAKHFRAFEKTGDGKSLSGARVQLPFVFDPAVLSDDKPAIGKPQWAGLPSADDTNAAFEAITAAVSGTVRVMLRCTVQPGGSMADCSVEREEPTGKGVGQAALALASHFRVATWTMEGLPTVGGTIHIPIRYEGGVAAPAPAAPAKP